MKKAPILALIGAIILVTGAAAFSKGNLVEKDDENCIILEIESTGKKSIDEKNIRKVTNIIKRRLEYLGVSGVKVKQEGIRNLAVYTGSFTDINKIANLIVKPSQLEFKLVDEDFDLDEALKGNIPEGDEILYEYRMEDEEVVKTPFLIKRMSLLTGNILERADVKIDNQFNEPYINIKFNERGRDLFYKITKENIRKRLAIIFNGIVISAPVIQEEISGGNIQITGLFTEEEARDISIVLNSGSLPVAVKVIEQKTVASISKSDIQPAPPTPLADIHNIPDFKATSKQNALAVIIGIENYQSLPKSDYSKSDAGIVKDYLKALGFAERNIEFIADERATKSSIEKSIEAWLPNRIKKNSTVFIYYSGHGAPEPKTGDAYIVPFDGDPNYLEVTGYPLKRLYEKLGKLEAQEVIVLLDSCFSGAGGRSVLAKGARPLIMMTEGIIVPQNMAVLTATQGTQISSSSQEKGHGVFTYYFLKALKDGKKNIAEIYEYIKPLVEDEAKQLNVQQSPSINPDIEKLKGRFELRK